MSRDTIIANGTVAGVKACLLVPSKMVKQYHVLCKNSLNEINTTVRDQLKSVNGYEMHPDAETFKAMLYNTNESPHVDNTDDKIYFNFPAEGNAKLLATLQAIASKDVNGWSEAFASPPSLSSVVETLWNFLKNYGAHISLLMLVVGIAVMLMSSDDDPKSFIPKNTQKWLSTTSTAKKVVDVGSFWHRHFGEGRQDYNRPNYDDDRPDQPWQKFQDRVPQQMLRPNHFALPFNRPDDGFESLNFN
jgi:hypothetical protein